MLLLPMRRAVGDVVIVRFMPSDSSSAGGRGLALAHDYFLDAVEPILDRCCRGVPYAAARVGAGSDVLALDDAMSQDHDWGLRLQVFVSKHDVPGVLSELDRHLPSTYQGHPVRFAFSGQRTARLGVDVTSPKQFAHDRLGFDPTRRVTTSDWLSLSGQAALEVVSGEVFKDQVGDLTRLRQALAWYPDDIWRYIVACDWQRLDQELPVMARAGDRGDELGSRTIAARLVEVAVHLAFTLSRAWQPYSKWRGTMFRMLAISEPIAADLQTALAASRWQDRSDALRNALEHLARFQAEVGLPTSSPAVVPFWTGRTYRSGNRWSRP